MRTEVQNTEPIHPQVSRRTAVQAGAIGLLGLGMNHRAALAEASPNGRGPSGTAKSCIFIFLSGGLAQHESFDMKPDAPDTVRGEFQPISTETPGLQICEHLPELAKRSQLWSLCRSITHSSNEHSAGHHIMLTGRSDLPTGFNPSKPLPTDHPAIASIVGELTTPRNNLPPAVVLPERLVHRTGRVIPGAFGGQMGPQRDPWFVNASPFHTKSYGAYPDYAFDHQERGGSDNRVFQAPNLTLPHGLTQSKFARRTDLLASLEQQRRSLEQHAETQDFDRFRQGAISLLSEPSIQHAFDVTGADAETQDRYGRNAFGWSLLMARRLVASGVNLVQVNLGNNETWDTHGNAFPHLKDKLFPPTDRAVSALLDDLKESGQLDETLVVIASEFGRTPKISLLANAYELPGRDHWGAVQSVLFAGGGMPGGAVVGSSDAHGGYPEESPHTPEDFAATIYHALGIPSVAAWKNALDRPHHVYHGDPIFA
ncbi:DUF1501 domain-containing protein [Thalassoroseus pseudoceratinae]|uniref:DUF1501 domain-containing protein n=1 Tax=Thalassoroseus pseudoceratinae TaxID=2713176 RepID=UPI0014210DA4|nr:DUF1501 domain-containing protein [Thalassoroseus pseudoceratinae]